MPMSLDREKEKPKEKDSQLETASHSHFFPPPSLSNDVIKTRIWERLKKGESKELATDLASYRLTPERVSDFFSKEGPSLLRRALNSTSDNKPLKFLIERFPKEVLKILTDNDYAIFRAFLRVRVALEQEEGDNEEEASKDQVGKFEALLSIDGAVAIFSIFMKKNEGDKTILSENILGNFNSVLARHRSVGKSK